MANSITKSKVLSGAPAICFTAFIIAVLSATVPVEAQRIAVLTPDNTEKSIAFAAALAASLEGKLRLLDRDLGHAAYLSTSPAAPFNSTSREARTIGAAIGCDAFVLVRSVTQRRSAFGRDEYYEAYAAIYVISSRTGRLLLWKLASQDAARPDDAEKKLFATTGNLSNEIIDKVREALSRELNESEPPSIEEVPEAGSPLAKNFRAPVPYLRIKPEYTAAAAFYEIAASVEAVVDLDAAGSITRVEITRWAGYGLDESVEAAIRKMNWRPAERNGKPLPLRFLLRYNFKELDKETPARQ